MTPATRSPATAPHEFPAATGSLPAGIWVALVVSRYNDSVTRRLRDGGVPALVAAGLPPDRIDVAWVPGAFELPLAADRLAASGRYAAVLCLGAIIKGETSHDRHIATAVASGIEQIGRVRGLPELFGVLTCDTLAQAMARAAGGPACRPEPHLVHVGREATEYGGEGASLKVKNR